MKSIFLLGVSLLVLFCEKGSAVVPRNLLQNQATLQEVKDRLLPREQWIAYPKYKNRAGWDQFTRGFSSDVVQKGVKKLSYQWQVVKATDYLEFERSGSREIMEKPYNENISTLTQLIVAELTEGKGRFLEQIINGVWTLCDMQSWALSAHLSAQKYKRSLPDPEEEIIDLAAGDVGSLLSWALWFFKEDWDQVNPMISKRVEQNLRKRILEPYMQRSDYWWQALQGSPGRMVNNWNPWCNANVLACFLLVETNKDVLAEAVHRTMKSVDQFLNYVKEDGACEEGPSYWGHAAGKLYDYLQLLSDATGGRISLFNQPMIKNMGTYIARSYVGKGWVVNFADASAKGSADPALIYRYGKAVNSIEMQAFAATLLATKGKKELLPSGRDMFRILESLSKSQQFQHLQVAPFATPATTWYPQTEFCYMQDNGLFFAAKGGFNDESHNHNDVGSFNLYVDSVPFIIDVGVGSYTRQTFSSERYSIWTMQSNYHNLPLINGAPQLHGRNYKASSVVCNEAKKQFQLTIADAYGSAAHVKKWTRTFQLSSKGLQLTEDYVLNRVTDSTTINFMTWMPPNFRQKGKVVLEKDGKSLTITYNPNQLQPQLDTISVTDKRLSDIWGNNLYRLRFLIKNKKLKGNCQLNFYR